MFTKKNSYGVGYRKEGVLRVLEQVDSALLRKDESRKHLEWRLCGSGV
jgi:hypothetical protein